MTVLKNCDFPDHLLYDVDHDLWAEEQPDGSLRMGVTDVGQTRAGKIRYVSFPRYRPGRVVTAGRSLALVESAKWVGAISAPAGGTLLEANHALLEEPLLINLDPYGDGWIVRFLPDEPVSWSRGAAAMEEYRVRLQRRFVSVAGPVDDFWCVHCNDWGDE